MSSPVIRLWLALLIGMLAAGPTGWAAMADPMAIRGLALILLP
jgi:hypothetical protein